MRIVAWGLVLLLGGCSASLKDAPWRAAFGYEEDAVEPIDIGDFGFPFVPVQVGADTVWLPFDTGNMVGLTLKSELFRRLGLPCSDRWRRLDSGGDVISTGCVARGVSARVFDAPHDSVSVYEFFDENLPGLVGPGMVPGSRFTVDWRRELMAVGNGDRPDAVSRFVAIPLVRSPRHARLILVRGTVGGREVLVEIDTGKSRTTIDRELVEELGLERTSAGAMVGEVQLGPRTLPASSARVVNTAGISRGLPMPISLGIGSDRLSQFVFTVDYELGLLWIERP